MIGTLRVVRWLALGLVVLLAIGVAVLELRPRGEPTGGAGAASASAEIVIGGPFHLIDDKGHAVTDATYRGRWMMVFFGYTNCRDVCPATLANLAAALDALGPLAAQVQPLFVTVDPARDTPGQLADYVKNFDPRIIGLTGSSEQIAAVAKAYRVYYSPAQHEASGTDLVSHSTLLYLMNPAGSFDSLLPSDVDADALAAALRSRIVAKT